MFQGVFTALVTPFANGKIDEKSFADFVRWQIESGVNGLVPCGTTGESPTLSHAEHNRVIELSVAIAKGSTAKIIAGTGSNSTEEAISTTIHAEKVGADAALLVSPYYNKPSQEGLYQHFKAIHDNTNIPLIIYNIPGRSVIDLNTETLLRLFELPRIVGIKDATGEVLRATKLKNLVKKDIYQLTGDDANAMPFNLCGGSGVISVTANIMPELLSRQQQAWLSGDYKTAMELHFQLAEINEVLFIETNPAPVKYALSLMNKMSKDLRLPLVDISDEHKEKVKNTLKKHNLI